MGFTDLDRGAGVLCHISSLPGKYGIGTVGREAYEFADFLKSAHVRYWQVLPLSQTGFGDSPYQSVCCNSGNPYFIDLEALKADGLLYDEELKYCEMPAGDINYGELYERRFKVLRLAYARFNPRDGEFTKFVASGEFEDYAMFMSLKSRYPDTFDTFPDVYKYREAYAMSEYKSGVYKSEYLFWQFLQFIFKKQWAKLKNYVNSLGIKIIGDMPLYVAYDSSDVWAHSEIFMLDGDLKPEKVAGVPPDYFSETGQLWGNPLYDWKAVENENYRWWVKRFKKAAELFDVIRIDHFRGLDRYYAIPAGSETAENGEWEYGPGMKLFHEVKRQLGDINLIAEDLGVMDRGVERLRQRAELPGMKILLFAFDGDGENPYLPQNIDENSVVYTGTHDNMTSLGYILKMDKDEFKNFKTQIRGIFKELGIVYPFVTAEETVRALCILAMACKAKLAVIPIQDVLALDNSARMNTPSTTENNWKFRLLKQPSRKDAAVLRTIIKEYDR